MGGTSYSQYGSSGGGGGGSAPYAGSASLASGVESVSVSFTKAFSSAPIVIGWLTSSSSSDDIIVTQGYAVTASGFSAQLSSSTANTHYTFNWIASASND